MNCRLAASSIRACLKAFSDDITYEERPDKERTSRADSRMLWLIKLKNILCSILYFANQTVYTLNTIFNHDTYSFLCAKVLNRSELRKGKQPFLSLDLHL